MCSLRGRQQHTERQSPGYEETNQSTSPEGQTRRRSRQWEEHQQGLGDCLKARRVFRDIPSYSVVPGPAKQRQHTDPRSQELWEENEPGFDNLPSESSVCARLRSQTQLLGWLPLFVDHLSVVAYEGDLGSNKFGEHMTYIAFGAWSFKGFGESYSIDLCFSLSIALW